MLRSEQGAGALDEPSGRSFRRVCSQAVARSFPLASYLCCLVLILSVASSDRFVHWFVVPIWLCGVLVAADAVDWFRGRLNVFDPIGIVGLLGLHFFFFAPLVHVYSDYWMSSMSPPADWRDWLGGMAFLNFLGLLVYRFFRSGSRSWGWSIASKTVWLIDHRRFLAVLPVALILTGVLQFWVYHRMGGVLGYMSAYGQAEAFQGMGWIFMISESFPIIALIAFAIYARHRRVGYSWAVIISVLLAYLSFKLFFGGLRGSRSNTIWGVFWAVGIIHFWVRRVPKKAILVGIVCLVSFMYLYGFYKALGVEALEAFKASDGVAVLAGETGRTLEVTILSDLARSDVQAFLLYRLLSHPEDYQFGLGRTYLGAAALLVPRFFWPGRPPTKVKEGTDVQYGAGSHIPGKLESSRVYGLAGEAMLNFGPLAVPLAFAMLGLVVARVRHILPTLRPEDARFLLYPLLINLCFVILVSDSDNVVFFILKNGALPFLVVAASSRRITVSAPSRSTDAAIRLRPAVRSQPRLPIASGYGEASDQ